MAERRAVSFHEAGHAVAQHYTGMRVERVSTEATALREGYSYASPPGRELLTQQQVEAYARIDADHPSLRGAQMPDPPTGADATEELLRLLAGTVAEEIATGTRNERGASSDLAKVRWVLRAAERPYLEWMWDLYQARIRTRALLGEHWAEVARLAAVLERRGSLTGDEVRRLLAGGSLTAPSLEKITAGVRRWWHSLHHSGKAPSVAPPAALPFGLSRRVSL